MAVKAKTSKIKGGYVLMARVIEDKKIAHMPPATRALWYHILRKVNFKTTDALMRGMGEFTISDIREALHWTIGFKKEYYSNKQIISAFDRLKNAEMIDFISVNAQGDAQGDLQGDLQGFVNDYMKGKYYRLVTVLNYAHYQDKKNYEGRPEDTVAGRDAGRDAGRGVGIPLYNESEECKKNVNKEKREKEKNILSKNGNNFSNISLNFFNHPEASNISEEILKTRCLNRD